LPVDDQTEYSAEDPPDLSDPYVVLSETSTPGTTQPSTEATIEAEEPLPEFDPKFRDEYEGLLYTGKLYRTFRWAGHKFRIKTLTVDEALEVGLATKQYVGTSQENRAWQTCLVGACTVSVDGKLLPRPLSPDESEVETHFLWAKGQYPWTIDKIFEEFSILESTVTKVLEQMGKASGAPASAPTSTNLFDLPGNGGS
jgi:hypothetical protein